MSTGITGTVPRASFAGRRRMVSETKIIVRRSTSTELYDSYETDDERTTITRKSRSQRRASSNDRPSSALRPRRQLRRRQVVAAPEPEESEDEGEAGDDAESGDEDEADSSDSSESGADGVESGDSESSLDSISSGSEDEESEDEEEEEEEASPAAPSSTSGSAPSFQTLVPGAPQPSVPSSSEGEESAIPSSSTSAPSRASSSATATQAPSQTAEPSEEVDEPLADSESTGSIELDPAATSVVGDPTAPNTSQGTEDAASASQISDGESGAVRGKDVGIVIGTIALAGLLILAGVLFYRRRRRSNQDHLERLDDEKSLPPNPPTFRLSAPPPPRFQRSDTSIMDEAMGAAYQAEAGGMYGYDDNNNNAGRDFQQPNYGNENGNGQSWLATNNAPVSPVSPGANANLSPAWKPSSPGGNPTQRDFVPMAVPEPARLNTSNGANGYYAPPPPPPPPPVDQRYSFAQTEATGVTDSTWSTFANERMKANGGKLPFKERVMGHF